MLSLATDKTPWILILIGFILFIVHISIPYILKPSLEPGYSKIVVIVDDDLRSDDIALILRNASGQFMLGISNSSRYEWMTTSSSLNTLYAVQGKDHIMTYEKVISPLPDNILIYKLKRLNGDIVLHFPKIQEGGMEHDMGYTEADNYAIEQIKLITSIHNNDNIIQPDPR